MKKISISLIFLIASSLTFTNDLLNGYHQENPEIVNLKKKINGKIDGLAKNEDKKEIKDFFRTNKLYTDLTELKKVEKYVDALFEDYDANINYLRNCHASHSNEAFLYLVNRKKSIDQKIDALSKTANHALDGVSLAVAMANLPTVSSEYNHNISASYGTYAGSHSFALGLSGHIVNDRLSYKLSGAVNTKGNLAFGVGVGVNLGKKNQTNKELLDRIEKLENLVKQLQNK